MKTFEVAEWDGDKKEDKVLKQLKELGKKQITVKGKKKSVEEKKLKKIFAKQKAEIINAIEGSSGSSQNFIKRKKKKQNKKTVGDKQESSDSNANNKNNNVAKNNSNRKLKIKNINEKTKNANTKTKDVNTKTKKTIGKEKPQNLVENPYAQTSQDKSKNTTKPKKRKKKLKLKDKLESILKVEYKPKPVKEKNRKLKSLSLREKMEEKLKAAKFRFLNEQIYTTTGSDMHNYFKTNTGDFEAYHEGYRQQVSKWPMNPLDAIIKKIRKMPATYVVADFGCGEAELSKSVKQQVHSFDLVAKNESVTACDMAHVPLEDSSVDVAVFCLSLMGTNLQDYLTEAHRVLKIGGLLKIADVESRFESVEDFINGVEKLGFAKTWMDLSHNLFYFLDFKKTEAVIKKNKTVPEIKLKPCLYKKR